MNFLIDVNLPPELCAFFAARGHVATAARDLGLRQAEDDDLWLRAVKMDAVIVTKDEDFAARRGRLLYARFEAVWDILSADLALGTEIIEVR